jgi:hypothetical protein
MMKMGFLLESIGANVRLTITAKESFRVTHDTDGNIMLGGPSDAWRGLAELLAGEFLEADELNEDDEDDRISP